MLILCPLIFVGNIVYTYVFQGGRGTLFQFALAVSMAILSINAWLVLRIVKRRELLWGGENNENH
jgi:hypothetical protein